MTDEQDVRTTVEAVRRPKCWPALSFLRADAEAYRTTMGQHPPLDGWVFSAAVAEWAYMNDSELDAVADLLAGAR